MDSGNSEIDPNQIDIDLGHISVRDPTTRDILRRQMERGNITHSDITTLQKYQGSWNYSVCLTPACSFYLWLLHSVTW